MTHRIRTFLTYLYIFLLPTQLGVYWFAPFSFINGVRIDYLAPALFISDLIGLLLISLYFKYLRKIHWQFVVILILILSLNVIFSISPFVSIYRSLKLLEVIFILFIFVHVPINKKYLLTTIMLFSVVQLILVMLQLINQSSIQGAFYFLGERYHTLSTPGIATVSFEGRELLRPYGTFSHPNSMGGFFLLLYVFVLFAPSLKKYHILYGLSTALSAVLIITSFSKSVILLFAIFTIFNTFSNIKNGCTFCKATKVLIYSAVASIFIFLIQGDPGSWEKRIYLGKMAISIIFSHPLFGTGIGAFIIALSEFSNPYSYLLLQPVHNIFLLLISGLGIPIFLFMTYLVWKYRRIYNNRLAILCIAVIFTTGMLDHYSLTLQQNLLLMSVVLGLSMRRGYDKM